MDWRTCLILLVLGILAILAMRGVLYLFGRLLGRYVDPQPGAVSGNDGGEEDPESRVERQRIASGRAQAKCQRCGKRFEYDASRWGGVVKKFCDECDGKLWGQVKDRFQFKSGL